MLADVSCRVEGGYLVKNSPVQPGNESGSITVRRIHLLLACQPLRKRFSPHVKVSLRVVDRRLGGSWKEACLVLVRPDCAKYN